MKLLLIEDEPLVARDLVKLLTELLPDAIVLGTMASVREAIEWFENHPLPDLILSDIQLSDGISFEIFESHHIQCPVIFTTAYDEYAIRAFKLNSIDYLLKPVDKKELARALDKYKMLIGSQAISEQLRGMLQQWGKEQRKYKERFLAIHRNSMVPLDESSIAFFQKEELIFIQTMENERVIGEHQTLDEIESLVNPAIFFRVNRQYIIHLQTVARIKTTHKGLTIQLKPPFSLELDISREKAAQFKDWMTS